MSETYKYLSEGLLMLKDAEDKLKKEKANILIGLVEKLKGNERIVNTLKEKGLPNDIYVGWGIKPEVIASLSFFCPVIKNSLLKAGDVLFSWEKSIAHVERDFKINFEL